MAWNKVFRCKQSKKQKQSSPSKVTKQDSYEDIDENSKLYEHGELFIERCYPNSHARHENCIDLREKKPKLSKAEFEVMLYYMEEFKRNSSQTRSKSTMNRRRNAVCEQNLEERFGLGLCLQRHQHNEYMLQYEMWGGTNQQIVCSSWKIPEDILYLVLEWIHQEILKSINWLNLKKIYHVF